MTDRITFAASVEAEGRRLRGGVVLAGSRTWRNGEWLEVDPAAVVKADAKSTVATWEHDDGKVLGAISNGTLRLSRTDQGIEYEIDELPNTTYANDALELVRGKYVTGTSFEIEGLRSSFTTDPDGTRVRRITSIARLVAVNPVRDPAFVNSTVAAFSKESDDMTTPSTDPAPEVTPPPVITPVPAPAAAAFSPSDAYATAEAFARSRDLADLEQAMDNLIAGGLDSVARQETYNAFAKVYDERAKAEAEARNRREALALAHDMRRGRGPKAPESREVFESEDYREAFSQYLRTGHPQHMEQFAQAISGDGTQGGFLVPDGFLRRITERIKAYGGIAELAEEITTSTGESLRWPSNDDTSNVGAIATENTAVASGGADLVFDNIELGAFTYDATGTGNSPLVVSRELIQDSAFDLPAFIERKLGQRIGRKQAAHFATGMGGTEPLGLLSKTADTMTATVVSLAAPEHILQVDQAYREQGGLYWVMSDTTLAKVWTSQTTTNQPMFMPGGLTINGKPFDTLYGYPIKLDQGAGSLVAFGNIAEGYIIRRVRGVEILADPYTQNSKRQIAYHAWARADATINDSFAYSVSSWSGVSADT